MMNNWLNAKIVATLPIFIAVNIVAIIVWQLDISQQTMPLILGIIAGGLTDLDNRLTGRLKNVFYTLIAFSISSVATQLMIGKGISFSLLMMLITFIFTMIGALGQRYSTIAFGTLIVALYTTLAYIPSTAWYVNPILILCGTIIYSLCSLTIHIIFPNRPVQESVAVSFLALAEYLEKKSHFFDPDDIADLENKHISLAIKNGNLIDAFNNTRTILFNRISGQHRHARTAKMIKYYFVAQEIHERINSSHLDHLQLLEQLKNTDLVFRILRLLEIEAQSCRNIAYSLQNNQKYCYNQRLDQAITGLTQSLELYLNANIIDQKQQLTIKTLVENLQFVAWQLKHIDQTQTDQEDEYKTALIHTDQITGVKNMFLTIYSHFTFESQLFRHAVRLSIVVFTCCMIVELLDLSLGYWILLTAILVCQPNYSSTKVRLKQRVVGTILGVIVASLIPYIQPTLELQLGLIVATSSLFFFFRVNNYSFSTFFITLQVIISFNIMGFDVSNATFSRLLDTLIGTSIAWFAVSYLWPDWKYLTIKKVIHQTMKANAKYFVYIIGQLQFGKGDPLKYRIARRKAHETATALSTTISNMNNEPQKYQHYLQDSFELLKLNYSLLSYISALGAYRKNMQEIKQNITFLAGFYPVSKKLINILENIDQLEPTIFNDQILKVEYALKKLNNENNNLNNDTKLSIPLQQINLICQILPALYNSYHRIEHKTNN
ncbi:putative membrane protein (TIGR01666 family) [Bisgaardia hudsonensis]|uniref:Putative membrane protein (TIGR01666 family) n=2 Tax=Bisgaardia hudsonensis TaxID=109472 RepID=A0A4R2MU92_9PAST|nr:putative membrane protein (TIGR01666 family) [Bisgaardia hudsonensis]